MTTNTNFPTAYPSDTATNTPKQINLARPNDTEVITFGAFDVSNLACDLSGISDTLHDISQLLSMIYREDITHAQAKAMARISQCNVEAWENSSHENLNRLNVALKQSSFGEVEV